MKKIEELLDATKINNLLHRQELKKRKKVGKVLTVIGIVLGVLAIAYVVYRFVDSRRADDFDEEFNDDFDDDFFEDDSLKGK